MKNLKKNDLLIPFFAVLAVLAGFLRRGLYAAALDEKGLLTRGHPLAVALWVLVLAGAALAVAAAAKGVSLRSPAAMAGNSFMAVTLVLMALYCALPLPRAAVLVWKVLGFLAAPALVWAGISRRKGDVPFFGSYAAMCLFLLIFLVTRYQLWSSNPQLQDYVFDLLALVGLVLLSYYRAAASIGMGKPRLHTALSLLTVLLCGAAFYGAQFSALPVAGLVWAATDHPAKEDGHDPA